MSIQETQTVVDCEFCGRSRTESDGCLERRYVFDDDSAGDIERADDAEDLVEPIPFGEESAGADDESEFGMDSAQCSYCGALKGHYHHPLCTAEECPSCGDHLWFCDCRPRVLTRI
ncbi:MAG: hypothetical protein ABEJ28_09325 [Salinigranum sp.]